MQKTLRPIFYLLLLITSIQILPAADDMEGSEKLASKAHDAEERLDSPAPTSAIVPGGDASACEEECGAAPPFPDEAKMTYLEITGCRQEFGSMGFFSYIYTVPSTLVPEAFKYKIIDVFQNCVTPEHYQKVLEILGKYADVFAPSLDFLSDQDLIEAQIADNVCSFLICSTGTTDTGSYKEDFHRVFKLVQEYQDKLLAPSHENIADVFYALRSIKHNCEAILKTAFEHMDILGVSCAPWDGTDHKILNLEILPFLKATEGKAIQRRAMKFIRRCKIMFDGEDNVILFLDYLRRCPDAFEDTFTKFWGCFNKWRLEFREQDHRDSKIQQRLHEALSSCYPKSEG